MSVRVDQVQTQVLGLSDSTARVDQVAVEALQSNQTNARLDQVTLQVLYLLAPVSTEFITVMPRYPAVQLAEFTLDSLTQSMTAPFGGQSNASYLGKTTTSIRLTTPPLTATQATAWVSWIAACKGQAAIFTLPTYLSVLVPVGVNTTYWRLKSGINKWRIEEAKIYGLTFEVVSRV